MKFHATLLLFCLLMQACAKHSYVEAPVNTDSILERINTWSLNHLGLNNFLQANSISQVSEGTSFSINRLFLTGLFYDPEMQLAYKKWQQAKVVLDHSDYQINPELAMPFEHHSDTSDGRSKWTIGAVLSFIYERKGKREARKAKAELSLLNAHLDIKRRVFENYALTEEKYYAYVVKHTALKEIKNEVSVLKELLAQLQSKFELGAVSQFELNSTKLELQQGMFELNIEENVLQEIGDELLAMTYLTYSELEKIEIEVVSPLLFARGAYQQSIVFAYSFPELQKLMLENHVDLAIQLNQYAQTEAALRLKIEAQYPDIVLSPGFVFDQTDNVWSLGSAWVLPLFENTQQNLAILEALEERKIKQQEIIAFQKTLLNALYKSYRSIARYKKSIKASDELINTIQQRAEEIEKQIEAGGLDRIALLRNRLELYKAKQEQIAVYNNAVNALLEIEYLLQRPHTDIDMGNIVTLWLKHIKEKNENEAVH